MASYGEVTAGEILESRKLRLEIAALLNMSEKDILRDVSRNDDDTKLDDIYTPVPSDLEDMSVSEARWGEDAIASIALFTGLSPRRVERVLQDTHGRMLLVNAFTFVWPRRPETTLAEALRAAPARAEPARAEPLQAKHFVPRASSRPSIFASYSQKDRRFVDALRVHLKPLERSNTLEFWDDSKIKPGQKWREEIQHAIERASAAILFISANFLASDFIHTDEIPPLLALARQRGTVIYPLVVSHCLFANHPVLSTFQAFNEPGRPLATLGKNQRDKFFVKLVTELEGLRAPTP